MATTMMTLTTQCIPLAAWKDATFREQFGRRVSFQVPFGPRITADGAGGADRTARALALPALLRDSSRGNFFIKRELKKKKKKCYSAKKKKKKYGTGPLPFFSPLWQNLF